MWLNYSATKIQNFYRKYLSCSRDSEVKSKIRVKQDKKYRYIEIFSPLDPLYRVPFDERNHVRLVEWQENGKSFVWHFNMLSLIDWLNQCKEWKNPMTNCLFLNKTIDNIIIFVERNRLRSRLKLKAVYNHNEIKKKIVKKFDSEYYMNLLIKGIDDNDEDGVFNILNNNYAKIESDYFKIDVDIDKEIQVYDEKISPVGVIHYAIFKGNYNIIHHLMYYGINLEKKCGKNGYTALHLAAILNDLKSAELMKIYGADLMKECIIDDKSMNVFDICDYYGYGDFMMKLLV